MRDFINCRGNPTLACLEGLTNATPFSITSNGTNGTATIGAMSNSYFLQIGHDLKWLKNFKEKLSCYQLMN